MSPRPVKMPSLPETPGGWLSAFRFRTITESGRSLTPEELGTRVGASGATVRRWEAGHSRPDLTDLDAIVEACNLTDLEGFFLQRAFRAREGNETPPTKDAFEAVMAQVREADNPVVLFDSFLFVRAANAYARALRIPPSSSRAVPNRLAVMLDEIEAAATPEEITQTEATFDRWLREFWLWSATNCGTDAYVRMIRSLSRREGFAEKWRALGFERDSGARGPLGGPFFMNVGEFGVFRVLPVRMFIPPLYSFVELYPVDEVARVRLEEIRRTVGKGVNVAPQVHWSQGPFLSDGSFDLGPMPG